MTDSNSIKTLAAAIAEGGQPISAGAHPLRQLNPETGEVQNVPADSKFLAAAKIEAGQSVSVGGPESTLLQQHVTLPLR